MKEVTYKEWVKNPTIEEDADQEVDETFLIREDDGEWREPLVEV